MTDLHQDETPSPPFPGPNNYVLLLIVETALEACEKGEADVKAAITWAAGQAWYEGHVQGEDVCRGCAYRGHGPKLVTASRPPTSR